MVYMTLLMHVGTNLPGFARTCIDTTKVNVVEWRKSALRQHHAATVELEQYSKLRKHTYCVTGCVPVAKSSTTCRSSRE